MLMAADDTDEVHPQSNEDVGVLGGQQSVIDLDEREGDPSVILDLAQQLPSACWLKWQPS